MSTKQAVRSTWPIYLATILVAAVVAGSISYSFLAESLAALGIPDPGPATTFGLPALRGAGWLLAALSIGSFLFSAFLIPPDGKDLNEAELTVDGHIAARTGASAAAGMGLIGLVMIPMVMSDTSGTPLGQVFFQPTAWAAALELLAEAVVWLIVTIIAALVAFFGFIRSQWAAQPALLIGAVVMIVPLGMAGHAATGGDHDYGTNAYLWHLIFMAVWIGGLLALAAHGRRLGPHMEKGVARYSRIALFSFITVAISGVVATVIRIQPEDLFSTRYGLIIVAKIVGTLLLGLFGFAHRQLTIPKLNDDKSAFVRLAVVEVLIMAAVAGIAVTMGRTPPPPPRDPNLTAMQIQMGYNLYEAPSIGVVFTTWRFEILFTVLAILAAGYYLWLLRRVENWNHKYTFWWLLGCATLAITTSSGIGMYMPSGYAMHMVGHMILSMVVPLFLVLGAPLTLVRQAFPEDGFNPRAWAIALQNSKFIQIITYPPVSTLQFIFVFYVLYMFPDFYSLAISEHAGHVLMNVAFLVSGYFYFWELVGVDYIKGRKRTPIRLLWLWISMPAHLFMGVYLMQLNTVMGEEFYLSLDLPWNPDLLRDQKNGGGIAWASGSFPLILVFGMLFVSWRREDKEETTQVDKKLDTEGDDEWEAYNKMLADAAARDRAREEAERPSISAAQRRTTGIVRRDHTTDPNDRNT
ncbi:cytochrome c oxidase assembly protein [Corynebacterium cystitidis]|uniref:Putative copper resistance protein D n=1 Tax=Corynebacterium cystitidis DSM 20524 TaxID=1121357 RepID=A0A1H9SLT5_9CORY|nr:cytochrome c oxidase assembly protein [Corynebacterium cystitidis]WJY83096.1 Cytochrome c oxidase caa3 assembly factor [Corynebacterium cystitidis DSM 20524]SER85946.1 putative copper resistance protein D [Corynebacterium cystitidis DSM 20524]SNV66185.1 Copper resistance D domain-containing protein/Cytochrome c oxidase caa3 assembly factor (Caa3_CtaG) [Corynebacterium cystitidis]